MEGHSLPLCSPEIVSLFFGSLGFLVTILLTQCNSQYVAVSSYDMKYRCWHCGQTKKNNRLFKNMGRSDRPFQPSVLQQHFQKRVLVR